MQLRIDITGIINRFLTLYNESNGQWKSLKCMLEALKSDVMALKKCIAQHPTNVLLLHYIENTQTKFSPFRQHSGIKFNEPDSFEKRPAQIAPGKLPRL